MLVSEELWITFEMSNTETKATPTAEEHATAGGEGRGQSGVGSYYLNN